MRDQININEYVKLVNKYFKSDEIRNIMEVGSLDANDSLFFKKCFPNANVYAIEGLPDNYEKYMQNLKNIKCYNVVIANKDGDIDFYVKNINGIHGIYDRGQEYGNKKINVKCYKLETFCKQNNIKSIDMMKIDVEGATLDILQSMGDLLKSVKIMHIETEDAEFFKGQSVHKEVLNYLNQNGFMMIDLTGVEIYKGLYQHDSVWISKTFDI